MRPNRSMPASPVMAELVYPDVEAAVAWLADQPYGERQYAAEDLAGHRWTFSQTIADVAPEAWGGTPGAALG